MTMTRAVRLVAILIASWWSAIASATGARNAALNLDRWRMLDSTSIALTPSDMLTFKKVIYGELGNTTGIADDYAAAILPIGPGYLGIYVGAIPVTSGVGLLMGADDTAQTAYLSFLSPPVTGDVPQVGLLNSETVTGRVKALYGIELANGLRIVGGFSYYAKKSADDSMKAAVGSPVNFVSGTTSYADSASVLTIHAGGSMVLGPINPLSVGIEFGMPSFESIVTHPDGFTDAYASTSGSDINLNVKGRLTNVLGKDVDTIVYIGFGTGTLEAASKSKMQVTLVPVTFATLPDGKKKVERGSMTIGFSNNHRFGDSTIALWSLAYQTTASALSVIDTTAPLLTLKDEVNVTDIPLVLALETDLTKWLAGRFSSKSSFVRSTETINSLGGGNPSYSANLTTTTENNSAQSFALGLRCEIGERFMIDAVLQETFMFNGPFFIGGAGAAMFGNVSLTARI